MENKDAMTELRQTSFHVPLSVYRDDAVFSGSGNSFHIRHGAHLEPVMDHPVEAAPGSRTDANWIQTSCGTRFWPTDPRADEIEIEDVAHALSNICRYTGHCLEFFSVAQHSVIVSRNVPEADALWALLHDASEAYLADIARPVKPHLTNYRQLEDRVTECVAERFGLTLPMPQSVKIADTCALATERRDLMAPPPRPWVQTENVEPFEEKIIAVGPKRAKMMFLERFRELTADPEILRLADDGGRAD